MKPLPLLLLLCALLLAAPPARAECWDQCYQDCGNGMSEGGSGLCTSRCSRYCTDESSDVFPRPVYQAPRAAKYGAVAISPTTLDAAYSYNFDTDRAARADALKRCHEDTPSKPADCKITLAFANSCAALAIYKDDETHHGAWSSALGASRVKAEAAAMGACTPHAQGDCKIAGSFCSP